MACLCFVDEQPNPEAWLERKASAGGATVLRMTLPCVLWMAIGSFWACLSLAGPLSQTQWSLRQSQFEGSLEPPNRVCLTSWAFVCPGTH